MNNNRHSKKKGYWKKERVQWGKETSKHSRITITREIRLGSTYHISLVGNLKICQC